MSPQFNKADAPLYGLRGFGFAQKRKVTTLNSRIVNISFFVGAPTETAFELLIRRQKVKVPFVESFVQLAHILGGLFYFFQIAEPFAVGRIAYRNAIALARYEVLRGRRPS